MALLDFENLSQETKNIWARALMQQIKNSDRLNLFKPDPLAIVEQPDNPFNTFGFKASYVWVKRAGKATPQIKLFDKGTTNMSEENQQSEEKTTEKFGDMPLKHFQAIRKMDPPVKIRDIRMCMAGKISHDPRLNEYTVQKTPVSYNNEVLRFQAMGLPPGGGQGHDGWIQIHDVIYPLMARFQHDDDFILECTQLHGGIMWRLSSSNKVTLDQRRDLAVHEESIAKTWATRIIMRLQKAQQASSGGGQDAEPDYGVNDEYNNPYKKVATTLKQQTEGRILRKNQSPVRAYKWHKKLLDRYSEYPLKHKHQLANMNMGEAEKRLLAKNFPLSKADDAVDALKYGTSVHEEMERRRLAKSYGVGSERLKQRAKVQELIKKYEYAEKREGPTPSRAGHPWGSIEKKDLKLAYQLEFTINRIAKFHRRTELAIECRLERLKLVKRYAGKIENIVIIDDVVDQKELNASHKAFKALYQQEPIAKVDAVVRDKYGALAVLDIKTEEFSPKLSAKGIRGDEPLDLKREEQLTALREGLGEPLPFKEAPAADSAPLQALTTSQFKLGKKYIQVHSEAVKRFRSYYKEQLVSEDYLDELKEMQGKFYEVKGTLPACYNSKARKYVLLNSMTVEAPCVQAVYKTTWKHISTQQASR